MYIKITLRMESVTYIQSLGQMTKLVLQPNQRLDEDDHRLAISSAGPRYLLLVMMQIAVVKRCMATIFAIPFARVVLSFQFQAW
jgi:hypothetical protein